MIADTKECPFCGEVIKIIAKKCRHCGEFLDDYTREKVWQEINTGGGVSVGKDVRAGHDFVGRDLSQKFRMSWDTRGGCLNIYFITQAAIVLIIILLGTMAYQTPEIQKGTQRLIAEILEKLGRENVAPTPVVLPTPIPTFTPMVTPEITLKPTVAPTVIGLIRHQVISGETLQSIASQYDVSVADIQVANNLANALVRTGDVLLIPASKPSTTHFQYTVQAGDTITSIAVNFGSVAEDIKQVNSLETETIHSGDVLVIPLRESPIEIVESPVGSLVGSNIVSTFLYPVQAGDTLVAIATAFGTTVDEVKQANKIEIDTIYPNDVLIIPYERNSVSTIEGDDRKNITYYLVQAEDNILNIAARHELKPETIIWANPAIEKNHGRISVGDEIKILPVNGVIHTVKLSDTLSSLVEQYNVLTNTIVSYNSNALNNTDTTLKLGDEIIVPVREKPLDQQSFINSANLVPINANKGSGSFMWPISGSVTQKYWSGHAAVDIGSWTGAPVKASDSGYVFETGVGWNSGYGNYIIIDHGNGYHTLYAQLNSIFVSPGENVNKGEQIATAGSTGNSTGPHLHIEIIWQGTRRNPLAYFP